MPGKIKLIRYLCILAAVLLAGRVLFAVQRPVQAEGEKTGFIQEHGEVRYYDPVTHEAVTGQQRIDGSWYMFDPESAAMITGFYHHTEETNPSGGEKVCYYDPSGRMAKGQRTIDGYRYRFKGGTGEMVTGFLYLSEEDRTVYYDEQGHLLTGAQEIGGEAYVFDDDGTLISGEAPPEAEQRPV